ncbi:MAG: type IVB pilus formation outer membrane protein, R64 PilN family [Lysobacterales bacterium GWF1_69_6]|nr:MAG: type IVB pilus formation outer membrane protein, R64 PilN family [Xanthomonadales bacterium GWF1_69_6]
MRTLLCTAILTLLVAGCSSAGGSLKRDVHADAEIATAYAQSMRDGVPSADARDEDGIRVLDDAVYVAPKATALNPQTTLPTRCDITFAPAVPVSLQEFGQRVTKDCNLHVRITPDALAAVEGTPSLVATTAAATTGPTPMIPMPVGVTLPPGVAGTAAQSTLGAPQRIDIRYSGDVRGLLDAVTARLGLSWRYAGGVVSVFYLDTRIFRIHSLPTVTQMDSVVTSGTTSAAGVGGGSSSGGAGGGQGGVSGSSGSSQTTSVALRSDPNTDMSRMVSSMLTPNVGRMHSSTSNGMMTVTDTPETLDRIAAFVDEYNGTATKQVLLNVKVLTVSLSDDNEFGINWTLLYNSLADEYGIGLSNQSSASPDAISGSINILTGGNSRFAGSSVLVNALAKQGNVSVLTQPSVATLNNEPVPVQVARQTSYLAQVLTTQVADVGTSTSLTPGTVTTGFNMNLLPYILPDDETILLQYSINLSALNDIRRVESGDSAIEIPEVDNRIFSQKVKIRSGETLVLSGFEQSSTDTTRTGVGAARFWLLGGGKRDSKSRDVLVVLINPIVMN